MCWKHFCKDHCLIFCNTKLPGACLVFILFTVSDSLNMCPPHITIVSASIRVNVNPSLSNSSRSYGYNICNIYTNQYHTAIVITHHGKILMGYINTVS